MATILNRKKNPLSMEEAKEYIKNGVWVHCCDKGICLIGDTHQRWIDLSSILTDILEPEPANYSASWSQRRALLTAKVNRLLGKSVFIAF